MFLVTNTLITKPFRGLQIFFWIFGLVENFTLPILTETFLSRRCSLVKKSKAIDKFSPIFLADHSVQSIRETATCYYLRKNDVMPEKNGNHTSAIKTGWETSFRWWVISTLCRRNLIVLYLFYISFTMFFFLFSSRLFRILE